MIEQLDRRKFLRNGVVLAGTAFLASQTTGCTTEDPGRYTIYTDPRLTPQQRIDQIRAATAGHNETMFYLPSSDAAGEIWRPTMAEYSRPFGNWARRLPFTERWGINAVEVKLLQDHLFRGEENNQYRAFIIDSNGRVLRTKWAGSDRAENLLEKRKIVPNFYRNAVIRIQLEVPFDEDALAVANKGLEIHLETVDSERNFEHYAYQFARVVPQP